MSRKPAPIKVINLEDGMPKVEEARLRMQRELQVARQQGYAAVKLIHGYGSSGVGGSLRPQGAYANVPVRMWNGRDVRNGDRLGEESTEFIGTPQER